MPFYLVLASKFGGILDIFKKSKHFFLVKFETLFFKGLKVKILKNVGNNTHKLKKQVLMYLMLDFHMYTWKFNSARAL